MCSPEVMLKVRQEISRRRLLGQSGAALGVAAVGVGAISGRAVRAQDASPVAVPAASPVVGALPSGFTSVVDLSHVWGEDFPMFPGAQQPTIETILTVADDGFYKNIVTLDEHTGTHMDSPAHFSEGGVTADQLPIEQLIAPLCVLDISAKAADDPDAEGTVDDLVAWEEANGPLPAGAFVALYSGWETRVTDAAAYINLDDAGVQHYPGWNPDATAFLVEQRDIVGIGVDTLSLDYGASTSFATHITLLSSGRFGLENLANLGSVPVVGATLIAGGPRHAAASGGPTRAIALI